ncbi:MAG: hypothetical protein GY786_01790 [Proteobacteria bacterium]|nr:hypothetical protein [Pseudomonadota bacterium]
MLDYSDDQWVYYKMMLSMTIEVNHYWIDLWETVWSHNNYTYEAFVDNGWTET